MPRVQPRLAAEVLKSWDGGPESYSSVHTQKPSIYGDDFLSHGLI